MKITQFDAHNQESITIELGGPFDDQRIIGEGYFIIVNPNSKHVSFSKRRADVCFGDVTKRIVPNYTNQQYANEYGSRLTGTGATVKEFMKNYCKMDIS